MRSRRMKVRIRPVHWWWKLKPTGRHNYLTEPRLLKGGRESEFNIGRIGELARIHFFVVPECDRRSSWARGICSWVWTGIQVQDGSTNGLEPDQTSESDRTRWDSQSTIISASESPSPSTALVQNTCLEICSPQRRHKHWSLKPILRVLA